MENDTAQFLRPGRYIDSDHPDVIAFAQEAAGEDGGDTERALRLFYAVRDTIQYDVYIDLTDQASYRASGVLAAGRGYCGGKAALLSACARAIGVPARVGYADVKNHLTSPRLYEYMQTDLFVWHSYSELFLGGNWVKATPAFDKALCERVGLLALDFDGVHDSLFHPFDRSGRRHMEYVLDRGPFADVPFEAMMADFRAVYPSMIAKRKIEGDFRAEAVGGD